MKKGWKIFWIVCASLGGVAIALIITGIAMGASFDAISEAVWNRYQTEIADEFLLDSDDAIELDDAIEVDDEDWEDEHDCSYPDQADLFSNKENEEVSLDLSDMTALEIDVTHMDVKIVSDAESGKIAFRMQNVPEKVKKELMLVEEKTDHELKVFIRDKKKWKRNVNQADAYGVLEIHIPKEHNTLQSVQLDIGDGRAVVDELDVNELELNVGAGEVEIQKMKTAELDVEVGVGKAILTGDVTREASLECGVGLIEFHTEQCQEAYSYAMECGQGVIRLGYETVSGLMKESKILNGGPMIEMECGIGEIHLDFGEVCHCK